MRRTRVRSAIVAGGLMPFAMGLTACIEPAGPGQPPTTTTTPDDSVSRCRTERATLITAWTAAAVANTVNPPDAQETWRDYWSGEPTLQWFDEPSAAGAPRSVSSVVAVPEVECTSIQDGELDG